MYLNSDICHLAEGGITATDMQISIIEEGYFMSNVFISQVTFAAEPAQEDTIRAIIERKQESAQRAEGLLSSECWRSESADSVGYTLVSKWADKAQFTAWLAADHANRPHTTTPRPAIKKTGNQYYLVESSDK